MATLKAVWTCDDVPQASVHCSALAGYSRCWVVDVWIGSALREVHRSVVRDEHDNIDATAEKMMRVGAAALSARCCVCKVLQGETDEVVQYDGDTDTWACTECAHEALQLASENAETDAHMQRADDEGGAL